MMVLVPFFLFPFLFSPKEEVEVGGQKKIDGREWKKGLTAEEETKNRGRFWKGCAASSFPFQQGIRDQWDPCARGREKSDARDREASRRETMASSALALARLSFVFK
jgi:hypothetical protein